MIRKGQSSRQTGHHRHPDASLYGLESARARPELEVTDIANAILDGTDADAIRKNAAAGEYPLEAVKIMAQVAEGNRADSRTAGTLRGFGKNRSPRSDPVSAPSRYCGLDLQVKAFLIPHDFGRHGAPDCALPAAPTDHRREPSSANRKDALSGHRAHAIQVHGFKSTDDIVRMLQEKKHSPLGS
jgi:hypothetical protein